MTGFRSSRNIPKDTGRTADCRSRRAGGPRTGAAQFAHGLPGALSFHIGTRIPRMARGGSQCRSESGGESQPVLCPRFPALRVERYGRHGRAARYVRLRRCCCVRPDLARLPPAAGEKDRIRHLLLFCPARCDREIALRARLIDPAAVDCTLYVFDERDRTGPVDLADAGNIDSTLPPCRRPVAPNADPAPIPEIAGVDRVEQSDGSVSMRVRGLEFARWSAES